MSPTYKERLAEFASDMVEHYGNQERITASECMQYSVGKLGIDINNGTIKAPLIINSKQVGGNHYAKKYIQPWDYIVSNNMGYLAGNIIKYVSRYKDKNGIEDLKKAMHYLEKLIEVEENDNK